MKKKAVALILCGAMIASSVPVMASDFELESVEVTVDNPFSAEEEYGESEEAGAQIAVSESEVLTDGKEQDMLSQDAEVSVEDPEPEGPAENQEPAEMDASETVTETDASESLEEALPEAEMPETEEILDTEEAAGAEEEPAAEADFDLDSVVTAGLAETSELSDPVYTLNENEVFVSSWEYRNQDGKLQFRLAEPAETELGQAMATVPETLEETVSEYSEIMEEAVLEEMVQEEAISEAPVQEAPAAEEPVPEVPVPEEETSEELSGFLPLAEEAMEARSATGKKEYFTSQDGIVHIRTVTSDGVVLTEGDYLFDENGILLTGEQQIPAGTAGYEGETDGTAFFTDEEHVVLFAQADSATPANSDLGQQVKDTWIWTGSVYQYYDVKGDLISVPDLKAAAKLNASTYTGYFEIQGDRYVLKDDGTPLVGDYTMKEGIRPGTYYLYPARSTDDIPGKMAVSTWVYLKLFGKDRWRYYDADGRTDISTKKAVVLDKKLNASVGDKKYLLSEKGYVYTSAVMVKLPNGAYYGCNSKGVVCENQLAKFNNARYYFGKGGKRVTWSKGWHRCKGASNRFYYFGNKNGKIIEKKGWQLIKLSNGKNEWFYFPKNGNHYVSKWTNGKKYYFKSNGALASGLTTIGNDKYFFTKSDSKTHRGSVYKNVFFKSGSYKYYATKTGVLAKSQWVKINDNYYYFRYTGRMMKDEFVTGPDGKTHGYIDTTGIFKTGWVIVSNANNQIKCLNPVGRGFLENTAFAIDGVRYYFDSDGYRVSDLTKFSLKNKEDDFLTDLHNGKFTGQYLLEVDKSNGVVCIYVNSSKYGKVPVRCMRTSVGLNIDNTPNGTYNVQRWATWTLLNGPSWGQYGSRVVGGIFMHSIACPEPNRYNLNTSAYDKLGNPASQGCIRLCVADAKWVYDNCNGCQITIFTGSYKSDEVFKSPLGRKPLVKRFGAGNFDPTDPAIVGNKYY